MKRSYTKVLLACCAVLVFVCNIFSSASAAPQRIALLPVQFAHADEYSPEIASLVAAPLSKKFYHSLNEFTKKYEYVTTQELQTVEAVNKSYSTLSDTQLKMTANALNADILLGPIVLRCIDYQYPDYWGELMQETYVGIAIIGYDRANDHIIRLKDTDFFSGYYTGLDTSIEYTRELMVDLMEELDEEIAAPIINK